MGEPVLQQAPPVNDPSVVQYRASADWWTDVREAKPRCRVKVAEGQASQMVTVDSDGALDAPDGVIVDYYEGDQYENIRAEEVL